jgi:hypothetical protein
VAGRALAFSDSEIIRLASQDYVAVAGDDWYQRRREDAEGEFFRKVADQGPRKGQGGSTRQGIYCLTAGGKLLAYKNAGQAPDVMREVLRRGLSEWAKLPEAERQPGGRSLGDPGKLDNRYRRTPPPEGLIINVYARLLERDAGGQLQRSDCKGEGGAALGSSHDHLWLTGDDWKSLISAGAKPGDRFPLPAAISERIAQFHLIDNTRGEPPMWKKEEIRSSKLDVIVEEATSTMRRLRVEGKVLLATDASPQRSDRGYEARLLGYIDYNPAKNAIERFDLVALGDHWGEATYTRGARPGRTPLGIAFELARGDNPADRVPPQAARELQAYLGTGH